MCGEVNVWRDGWINIPTYLPTYNLNYASSTSIFAAFCSLGSLAIPVLKTKESKWDYCSAQYSS